ncbi:lytic transglycosylase domain-containing protein [Dinoroseobacter shibae]|uniref:lytic transglycosylase domain-containing protein n=1 Tax=Dinoroseobacter shibae TaxID=215813 RepID=UPI0005C53896|nr:lytic transglycosylase domain-containing protein [Dinoroseobacter shibae]URF48802.1 lytic transglycosylase domain-containing protein [Dinoroseobacter shibae]URF53114.1 lytic transglycosylase domain-containing protein [Dinoroseobacter shibae]
MPTNDSGLTARDIVETGDREADLAIQADKLSVRELIAEIEREQLATLQRILDAQSSFGGQGLPAMVSGLESGSGDPDRAVEAVYGTGEIDPNRGGAQMFGDASENIEQLIIRVAQETSGFAGVGRAGLSPVQWRALLQALIWQESRFTIGARSPVGAFGLTQIMPGTASDLGINPDYYDSPYLQVHGGARYLATQLNTFDGNIINALAAYNAGPGRVFEYGGVPPFRETQHYVQVIPERYNLYLSRIGGIEALGTIDPALLANANLSITGHGAAFYGSNSPAAIRQAALRIADIVERISETEDMQESVALNTYARAELVRLVAARIRLQAARTRVLSAEELAQASARMAEGAFMEFTIREID